MAFTQVFFLDTESLLTALSTITSPVFCEFVLDLDQYLSGFDVLFSQNWRRWGKIDEFFEERYAERENFRVVVRTSQLPDKETNHGHVVECFPLLAKRGCFYFEMSHG
jgi:hypothetical protein